VHIPHLLDDFNLERERERERARGRERVRERGGGGAGVKKPQQGKMVLQWGFRVAKKLGLSTSVVCGVVGLRDIVIDLVVCCGGTAG
jgi:hypothetical protein